MLVKPEPLPWKEPENEPENVPVPEDANEAVVAVAAFPEIEPEKNDEFSHLADVLLYIKAWPLVGPDILTSDRPDKVCVITDPPPPDPPTCLNRPAG